MLRNHYNTGRSGCKWLSPPDAPVPESDAIHVWRAPLDLDESHYAGCNHVLSEEEYDRANRFHFRKDREYFIRTRGLLRIVLARYLSTDASHLQFTYNTYGKPDLAGETFRQRLCFNITHSGDLALFAVAQERDIGIDVERIRPHFTDEDIIEQFFSPGEIEALRALPHHMQPEAFFCCWTRKEAHLKALGKGLALGLDRIEVPIHPGKPGSPVGRIESHEDSSSWSIWHLAPMAGYVGALVAKDNGCELRIRQWDASNFSL